MVGSSAGASRVHCAISVRPSSLSKATGGCFAWLLIDVGDSIFVDFRAICQSRTHLGSDSVKNNDFL